MKLEVGKTYLTAGGYVVPIIDESRNAFRTKKEYSPGLNLKGETVDKLPMGWGWFEDGTILLNKEWSEKLRIVEELPFPLPELPVGYKWAGGYPQFRKLKDGEHFLSCPNGTFSCVRRYTTGSYMATYFDGKRLIVEKDGSPPKEENGETVPASPEDWVDISESHPDHKARKGIDEYSHNGAKWQTFSFNSPCTVGHNFKNGIRIRCRRKDLPGQKDEWPKYIIHKDGSFSDKTAYILVKSHDTDGQIILKNGTEWREHSSKEHWKESVNKGVWKFVSREEAMSKLDGVAIKPLPFSGPGKYRLRNGQVVNLNGLARCRVEDGIKGGISGIPNAWYWRTDGTIPNIGYKDHSFLDLVEKLEEADSLVTKEEPYIKAMSFSDQLENIFSSVYGKQKTRPENDKHNTPDTVSGVVPSSLVEGSNMKKETALKVLNVAGNLAWRGVNYWLCEPTANIAHRIMLSVRYAVLFSGVTAGIFGYNYPEATGKFIKSCLPTIEVKAPEILR